MKPVVSMTFHELGVRLSGGPSAATNIPGVHTLLMAIQSTFDLEPKEPQKKVRDTQQLYTQKSTDLPSKL